MLECSSTACVSLPYQSSLRPLRPRDDIRIRSQQRARAASMIASCGRLHSAYAVAHSTPAARSRSAAGRRIACALSREMRSWSQNAMALRAIGSASPGGWYSGTAVKRVTLAFLLRASSIPAAIALSAAGEPSIGMRMCLYTGSPKVYGVYRSRRIAIPNRPIATCLSGCRAGSGAPRVLRTNAGHTGLFFVAMSTADPVVDEYARAAERYDEKWAFY